MSMVRVRRSRSGSSAGMSSALWCMRCWERAVLESVCTSLWTPIGPLGPMVTRDGPLACCCADAHWPHRPASEPEDEPVFSNGQRLSGVWPYLGVSRFTLARWPAIARADSGS